MNLHYNYLFLCLLPVKGEAFLYDFEGSCIVKLCSFPNCRYYLDSDDHCPNHKLVPTPRRELQMKGIWRADEDDETDEKVHLPVLSMSLLIIFLSI